MNEFLSWGACRDAVWAEIAARVESGTSTVAGIIKAAGVPSTTFYELFRPEFRGAKLETVCRVLAVLGYKPSWLDQFLPKPKPAPKPKPHKRKKVAAKSR